MAWARVHLAQRSSSSFARLMEAFIPRPRSKDTLQHLDTPSFSIVAIILFTTVSSPLSSKSPSMSISRCRSFRLKQVPLVCCNYFVEPCFLRGRCIAGPPARAYRVLDIPCRGPILAPARRSKSHTRKSRLLLLPVALVVVGFSANAILDASFFSRDPKKRTIGLPSIYLVSFAFCLTPYPFLPSCSTQLVYVHCTTHLDRQSCKPLLPSFSSVQRTACSTSTSWSV